MADKKEKGKGALAETEQEKEERNRIAKRNDGGPLEVPDFMVEAEHTGLEELDQFILPARIKIIQPQSGPPYDDLFQNGEVIVAPQMTKVAGMVEAKIGAPFFFAPLFFFPEWCLWNPYELKASLPAIRERTTDPSDPLVAKAQDPRLWHEPCPENKEFKCRYVEHLNFIVVLLGDHELADTPLILSFSRGEHRTGSNFCALLKMRKAAIYGCQFQASTGFRLNAKGNWFGLDVTNPSGDSDVTPFCPDQKRFEALQAIHLELKKAHSQSKIKVVYDEDTPPPEDDAQTSF